MKRLSSNKEFIQIPPTVFDKWLPILQPSRFMVLMALFREDQLFPGKGLYISMEELERSTGLSKTTLNKSLKDLLRMKIVKRTSIKDSSHYIFDFPFK